MLSIEFFKHAEITQCQLDEIIRTKQVAWPYSIEEQMKWMDENLKDSDVHCMLRENSHVVAYLNLVDEVIMLDGIQYSIWGVGNVCSAIKARGYGNALMERANEYIAASCRMGFLVCHDNLVPFYRKHKWLEVDVNISQSAVLTMGGGDLHLMIINCLIPFKNAEYRGRNF